MNTITVYTNSVSSVPNQSQFVATVEQKVDSNHYVVKVNNQLVPVISTDREFEIGDKLMLKIVGTSQSKIELNVTGLILGDFEDNALQFLKRHNIEQSPENTTLSKTLFSKNIKLDKSEFFELQSIIRSFPTQQDAVKDLSLLLLKNDIVPTKDLIKYLMENIVKSEIREPGLILAQTQKIDPKLIENFIAQQSDPAKFAAGLAKEISEAQSGARQAKIQTQLINAQQFEQSIAHKPSQPELQALTKGVEAMFDRATKMKLINTLNNLSGDSSKLYFEIPINNLSSNDNTIMKLYYEKTPDNRGAGRQQNTLYIGVDLEKSGKILARFSENKSRYTLDIYSEKESTKDFIKSNVGKLIEGLNAQGFKGTVSVHLERQIKDPPVFKSSTTALDLIV